MKAKSVIAGVALVCAVLLVGGVLYLVKQARTPKAEASGPPPVAVGVEESREEMYQPQGRLVGTVVGKRTVMLANEVVGVITHVGYESGESVDAGQVLLTLDDTTERADLAAAVAAKRLSDAAIEVAQANVVVAQADVEFAQSNYDRYRDAKADSVPQTDVDRARTDLERALATLARQRSVVEQARAESDQAQARVHQIETIIAKKTIRAPFKARVGMRSMDEGQYLAEGTQIVDLTELSDTIYIDFAVPQEYVGLVKPGTTVTARSNIIGAGEGNTAQIEVLAMNATVNPTTRNVRVRTSVPNPGFVLKPGMAVDVEVPIGPAQPSVTIPATALRHGAFGDHVFVLESPPPVGGPGGDAPPGMPISMKATMRMVKVGTNLGDRYIIESGLKAGERIAAEGSFKLYDGATALDMSAMPPAPGGGPSGGPDGGTSGEAPDHGAPGTSDGPVETPAPKKDESDANAG
ncbi:MAG: efflux RND transporter periplasmic adaptor subunit [Phycisphaerales bacterium]